MWSTLLRRRPLPAHTLHLAVYLLALILPPLLQTTPRISSKFRPGVETGRASCKVKLTKMSSMLAVSINQVAKLAICDRPDYAEQQIENNDNNMRPAGSLHNPTIINGVEVTNDNAQALLPPMACVFVAK